MGHILSKSFPAPGKRVASLPQRCLMCRSYHLLGRDAISSSTSISTGKSLIDLALGLSGMPILFIAESVVYVILKFAMHSYKFSTALWYSKTAVIQDALLIFLQIVNSGIYKKEQEKTQKSHNKSKQKKETQHPTAWTALFRALAFFLLKV